MSDRARRDRLKTKRRRDRPARAVDSASDSNAASAAVSAHTSQIAALDTRLDTVELAGNIDARLDALDAIAADHEARITALEP